jgi:SPP1 gp7 family putative phage head morphogenesis protein
LAVERRRESLQKVVEARKLTQSAADRQVIRYSNFLLTRRSRNIARTETASAYNFGAFDSMRTAVADGLIDGTVVKRFATAGDERVCPFCGPLDGKVVGLEETFPGLTTLVPNTYAPPVHPQCRCTIIYEVLDPINQPRFVPPLPVGFAAVTGATAAATLNRFTERVGENLNENEQQIAQALSTAAGASTAGTYVERAIVAESRTGNVQGAVGYTVQDDGFWRLNNIGELSSLRDIQGLLFNEFARDSAIHKAGITIPPGLIGLGLFRLLGVSEQQSENVTLSQPEVIELMQERNVSLNGS